MNKENAVLSEIVTYSKYARYIKEKNRRETWQELIWRNAEMHINKYNNPKLTEAIRYTYEKYVATKKVLPSMRSLQFGGKAIERNPARIYNCAYLPIEHPDAFSETMFLLLGGTGVGYSVQYRHVDKLPIVVGPKKRSRRYVIGDSIEGWSDAVKVLVEAYFYGKLQPIFDYDDIREKGTELVTSGGKAPGPDPLRVCLAQVEDILRRAIGRKLLPIEAHDIQCFLADAVLAGGIRRAAMISLFDKDNTDMLECKNSSVKSELIYHRADLKEDKYNFVIIQNGVRYNNAFGSKYDLEQYERDGTFGWWVCNPQRARANNSVILLRGSIDEDEFFKIWKKVELSGAGEPGIYWTNDLDWGTNPCCEIALRPYQFCNLVEVNGSSIESENDFYDRVEAGAFIATLQAGYTDFHYLRPIWKTTTEEDALIGVGITGIGSNKINTDWLTQAAGHVKRVNEYVANQIGINKAARTTTIKPSGTSSLVLGSPSGIHAAHAEYYIRRMRFGKDEAIWKYLSKILPELCEDEVFRPDSMGVLSIPQKAGDGAILRTESPFELLERVKKYNIDWVRRGHNYGENANNVSCTISIKQDEWEPVGKWMWDNSGYYNGISVLPFDGGTYQQAPFEDITQEEYERLVKFINDIDLSQVIEVEDNTDLTSEAACAGGACEIVF